MLPCLSLQLFHLLFLIFPKPKRTYFFFIMAFLNLVVADLWGPAPCFSNGKQYYISFVDAFTQHSWIYFLSKKSDALSAFLRFKKNVELQLGCSIKQVQTDGDGEFKSFVPHFHSNGIQHRVSCSHTSKQNGLVERRHRQIVEIGLVLLA